MLLPRQSCRTREFGRIGGRKNRQQLPETLAPTAMTAAELSRLLSEALRDVRSNKLGPRRAAAMSQLASVLNRTIQVSDVERRVSRLEERMVEGTPGVSSEVAPEGATEAAPVEVREEASGSNGSATVEEAEPTSDDDSRSGSNAPPQRNRLYWLEAAGCGKPLKETGQDAGSKTQEERTGNASTWWRRAAQAYEISTCSVGAVSGP